MANLRRELYAWRDTEAARRGVEPFRVLPNSTLDDIVRKLPRTKEELIAIKGIKEAKWRAYGASLLAMIERSVSGKPFSATENVLEMTAQSISVSAYLDIANRQLSRVAARVRGELLEFKLQRNALYAVIKDVQDESVLPVFMWMRDFVLSGIELREGMEVIVDGSGEVYKPNGRFNFRARTMELVGEGALKKAYDALRKTLEAEGLFSLERKRPIPEYPERIGLITSRTGAVINDFLTNLGKHRYRVRFCDSRVEGAGAIGDMLNAINCMKAEAIDVLVIIRGGGGSLELLQTFNNEHVVRAIATFPTPVICAIGHDKDVPLAQLAADLAPSTPSLCATALNKSWEDGAYFMSHVTKHIMSLYHEQLLNTRHELTLVTGVLRGVFKQLTKMVVEYERAFTDALVRIRAALSLCGERVRTAERSMFSQFAEAMRARERELQEIARTMQSHSPLRQLKLGYSIISVKGRIIRCINELPIGTEFEARLSDGTISARRTKGNSSSQ